MLAFGKERMPDHKKIRFAIVGLGHLAQVAVLPAFRNLGNAEIDARLQPDGLGTL